MFMSHRALFKIPFAFLAVALSAALATPLTAQASSIGDITYKIRFSEPVIIRSNKSQVQSVNLSEIFKNKTPVPKYRKIKSIEIWADPRSEGASFYLLNGKKVISKQKLVLYREGTSITADGVFAYSLLSTEPVPWPFVRLVVQGNVRIWQISIVTSGP
jgi:hypothetical protein